ncbi:hypothetical protein F7G04_28550, partial [Escherichia coli]
GLVRERPIDIHKDPVALNKYITEYLTTKGVFEDEGTNQSATDTLSSPVPETEPPRKSWRLNSLRKR